jgi:hypothetical protein
MRSLALFPPENRPQISRYLCFLAVLQSAPYATQYAMRCGTTVILYSFYKDSSTPLSLVAHLTSPLSFGGVFSESL